ncbi:hypothetical protein SNEBB_006654 [Seison nebaliae]|nr:hypothetical protein SNEBB_006654 [Seison nebaliae]
MLLRLLLLSVIVNLRTNLIRCQSHDWYFEILHPKDLRFTFKARAAKNFGVSFPSYYEDVLLVPIHPIIGCETYGEEMMTKVKNSVALVERGDCSFLLKSIKAQEAGAVAVVVMDNYESSSKKSKLEEENIDNFYDTRLFNSRSKYEEAHLIDMIRDESERDISIPAMFISFLDGYYIRRSLHNNSMTAAYINIPLNMTKIRQFKQRQVPWSLW